MCQNAQCLKTHNDAYWNKTNYSLVTIGNIRPGMLSQHLDCKCDVKVGIAVSTLYSIRLEQWATVAMAAVSSTA